MDRFKYPRTFHLDFSKSVQDDDKVLSTLSNFIGNEIEVSLKMDGENTTIYSDGYYHARSIDSKHNWTRNYAKTISTVLSSTDMIPNGYRLCCENLFAKHSIFYPDDYLDGYLYLLSIWDENNNCLSTDDVQLYSELLDLPRPKILYKGIFDYNKLIEISEQLDTSIEEGFVVRLSREIKYEEFSTCFTKFVREKHVQTDVHWLVNAVQNGKTKNPCKPFFMNRD